MFVLDRIPSTRVSFVACRTQQYADTSIQKQQRPSTYLYRQSN